MADTSRAASVRWPAELLARLDALAAAAGSNGALQVKVGRSAVIRALVEQALPAAEERAGITKAKGGRKGAKP